MLNPDLTVDELISSCLDGRDVVGDFKGFYLGHRNTVYRLLRAGELERVPTPIKSGRGRPATYISVSSIVNYIKTH